MRACVIIALFEPRHEIFINVVCATSKGSDQPAHTRSLIRAFASRLTILFAYSSTDRTPFGVSKLKMGLQRLVGVYTCQTATLLEITLRGSYTLIFPSHIQYAYFRRACQCNDSTIWYLFGRECGTPKLYQPNIYSKHGIPESIKTIVHSHFDHSHNTDLLAHARPTCTNSCQATRKRTLLLNTSSWKPVFWVSNRTSQAKCYAISIFLAFDSYASKNTKDSGNAHADPAIHCQCYFVTW